jgi:hypothetical protein
LRLAASRPTDAQMSEIKTAERRRARQSERRKKEESEESKVGSFVNVLQLNLAIAKLTGD